MALSTPYCSLLDLQDELKNNDSDTEADVTTRHENAINRASRMVDEWTHRDFTYHDHTSSMLTVEECLVVGDSIYLRWPIKTLTQVYIDGELKDAEDWKFEINKKRVQYISDWPAFPFDTSTFLQLKGTFGFTHADLTEPPTDALFPEGIRRATVIIAAAISGDYKKEVMGREGGVDQLLVTDIPKEAKILLRKYRRRFF